jgi:hypothetical protein
LQSRQARSLREFLDFAPIVELQAGVTFGAPLDELRCIRGRKWSKNAYSICVEEAVASNAMEVQAARDAIEKAQILASSSRYENEPFSGLVVGKPRRFQPIRPFEFRLQRTPFSSLAEERECLVHMHTLLARLVEEGIKTINTARAVGDLDFLRE